MYMAMGLVFGKKAGQLALVLGGVCDVPELGETSKPWREPLAQN